MHFGVDRDRLTAALAEIGRSFREAWEPEVARRAYKVLVASPRRGDQRNVYLVRTGDRIVSQFLAAHATVIAEREPILAKLRQAHPGRVPRIDLNFPLSMSGCVFVYIKRYEAVSQRNVTEQQAIAFLARKGKSLPSGMSNFCVRSQTGSRYKLIVRAPFDAGGLQTRALPLQGWSVIATDQAFGEKMAPSSPVNAKRRGTQADWRRVNGLEFLGRSEPIGGSDRGMSFLYGKRGKA